MGAGRAPGAEAPRTFVWNPYGVPGVVSLVLAWTLGAVLLRAGAGRPPNRRLALLLFLESALAGLNGGVMYLAAAAPDAFAFQVAGWALAPLVAAAYLSFVALLDTPLTRPLRSWRVRAGLFAAAVAASAYLVTHPFQVAPGMVRLPTGAHEALQGPATLVLLLGVLAPVYLYCLAAALHAVRCAPAGSLARRKARWLAFAFGMKDALLLVLFVLLAIASSDVLLTHLLSVALGQTALIAFTLVLSYALLKEQLLEIDLRLKWTIGKGTLAGFFLAAFFVATEVAQLVLGERTGSAYVGIVAAGALLFALAPLQRLADRLADAAMPGVADTQEYRLVRKREVYRAAVEGALVDGVLTERERDMLAALQEQLGLTPTEARVVEREAAAA